MAMATIDGNEATARIAHLLSEVVAIYPITPSSPMGESADAWSATGRPNLWGQVPDVVQLQSEAGAAGAVHGSLQAGALTTTFTASQGLLLMIPNMFKIAGELTPTVFHVAARSLATHALSIFGDHSDVMATRSTGWAMLASSTVQEAHDLALVAHVATLRSRVPFLHFFDGFRTSHEVATIETLPEDVIRSMVDDELIADHRDRSLTPTHPVLRGTAQNPDVFFQAREASNRFHDAVPGVVAEAMAELATHTGRAYHLVDYLGHPEAEHVVVIMGSGIGPVREVVEQRAAQGERIGAVVVRLFRPFPAAALVDALPASTRRVAVLDRTKEPGAPGEPLYLDVVAALAVAGRSEVEVVGGRYGLSSKEFTPSMVLGVYEALADGLTHDFTVGIHDDVTHRSIRWDQTAWVEPDDVRRVVFHGLGSDGTVSAAKATAKIIGDATGLHSQGFFEYDSKKSGSRTVSHLRFSPRPIHSTYLIDDAHFVGVFDFDLLEHTNVLASAAKGATVLLNVPHAVDHVWERLPEEVRRTVRDRELELWAIDAYRIAASAGLGRRVNTVLQTCFFHLAGLLPPDRAIAAIKASIDKAYGARGEVILRRNHDAVDAAVAGLTRVPTDGAPEGGRRLVARIPARAPEFVRTVTGPMLEGRGNDLPVSAFTPDGTFPTDTARWEKRSIALEIPTWDADLCIECGRCALVCPHAAIRVKAFDQGHLATAPIGFKHRIVEKGDLVGLAMTIQVAPDDCTGCGVCVEICPAVSKESAKHKAIDMTPKHAVLDTERASWTFFVHIPERDRTTVEVGTVKGSQLLQPLFEFSGACAGCGETPYVKLVSQLFGDRSVVANATGCSSIYGGNLPTTPWSQTVDGFGPAWSNSLFEDNAEFGLGMRLALDQTHEAARALVVDLADDLGGLADELLGADQSDEAGIAAQRVRVGHLLAAIDGRDDPTARRLRSLADHLVKTSVWIMGGDGWAYDIGFGGLDHVFASGRDVNILVLDTEVYSNTGGQASKSTPRAAVAKFASGGKRTKKKDLGQIAMSYGDVYVAQIAMGANMTQTVKAMVEAERHPGVSLVIAYSPCIAHGIDLRHQMAHQVDATATGYWPLYRYDPDLEARGLPGLRLDSRKPTKPFKEFAAKEGRFAMLARANPTEAEDLMALAQRDIDDRWQLYEQMVDIHRTAVYEEVSE